MENSVLIEILSIVVPSVVTFLITRFGFLRQYKLQNEKSQHEANLVRINTDKLAYETYNEIIQSFKTQVESITEQKNVLIENVKKLQRIIDQNKIEKGLE
jgi:hypothetical protein